MYFVLRFGMQMKNINNKIVYEFIKDSFESLSFWNLHINIQKPLQFLYVCLMKMLRGLLWPAAKANLFREYLKG